MDYRTKDYETLSRQVDTLPDDQLDAVQLKEAFLWTFDKWQAAEGFEDSLQGVEERAENAEQDLLYLTQVVEGLLVEELETLNTRAVLSQYLLRDEETKLETRMDYLKVMLGQMAKDTAITSERLRATLKGLSEAN